MKLLTHAQREQLLANGRQQQQAANAGDLGLDFKPVVKLFTPDASATWLLTEIEPNDPDRAFGLCDLGRGCPELGYVCLAELAALHGPMGLPLEWDLHFTAERSLSAYAEEARTHRRIVA